MTGSHVDVSDDRIDTYRALEINGYRVLELTDQPARLIGKDVTTLVAAGRNTRIEVEALAFYRNTVRAACSGIRCTSKARSNSCRWPT